MEKPLAVSFEDAQAIEDKHAAAVRHPGEPLLRSAKAARPGHGPAPKKLRDGGPILLAELPAKTTFSGTRSDRTGSRKFTAQQIFKAVNASKGNLSDAARRLGCARDTVYRAIKEHEVCRKVLENALMVDVELSTSHVVAAAEAGKPWAIKSILKSAKASRHGYGPAHKQIRRGGPIPLPDSPTPAPSCDRMPARRFTTDWIVNALLKSRGNVSDAARRLGCHRDTVARAVRDFPVCTYAHYEGEVVHIETIASLHTAACYAGEPWALILFMHSAEAAEYGYGPAPR